MHAESELHWYANNYLDSLVSRGIISEDEISELQDDLDTMNRSSGRADVAIGIMCGWIILQ